MASHTGSSLVALQPGGSKPPFYCVNPLYGDARTCRTLARHLGPDQPFYGLQPLGLDGKHALPSRVEDMAAHYIGEIKSHQSKGPYLLGGYSAGGIVAFEMAQQLHAGGHEVGLLAIVDGEPLNSRHRSVKWPSFLINLLQNAPYWLIYDLMPTSRGQLLFRVRRRVMAFVKEISKMLGPPGHEARALGIGDAIDLSPIPQRYRKQVEVHYQALMEYVPQVYPGRMTLFRARAQALFGPHDSELGWGPLAAGGVEVKVIPGSHGSMIQEPYVQVLAKELGACLQHTRLVW
jgi:thioesterase domain-containing protein